MCEYEIVIKYYDKPWIEYLVALHWEMLGWKFHFSGGNVDFKNNDEGANSTAFLFLSVNKKKQKNKNE